MPRIYAGQSAEDRTDARRRRLIEAAIALIGSRGLGGTTVRGVCEEAGLSTRSLYESFGSLDELAAAAYDDCVQSAFTTVYDATVAAGDDPRSQAHGAVGAIVDYLAAHPERARLMLLESLGAGPLASRRREAMRLLTSVIATLGRSVYGVRDGDEPLVTLTATLVAGGVSELMIAWIDGGIDLPRDRFVDYCATLLVAVGDTSAAAGQPGSGQA
jgi:AcrR family transcriptional regulator